MESERADGQREHAEEQRRGKGSRPERIGVAPERGDVDTEAPGKRDPGGDLQHRGFARIAVPDEKRDLADEEEHGEAKEDSRARAIEPAVDAGEGWHRESR